MTELPGVDPALVGPGLVGPGLVEPAVLDRVAARATAPSVVAHLGGWQLRAGRKDPFRRSSATVAMSDGVPFDLIERVERVEAFYRRHDLPARFQISPASDPPELDDILAARGYRRETPVDILVSPVHAPTEQLPLGVGIRPELEGSWIRGYAEATGDETDRHTAVRLGSYVKLLGGIEPVSVAVTVDVDAQPSAVGFGVLDDGFVGIFGMATRSDRRRRGAARAVLRALESWAFDDGASTLYLQVEADNEAARCLYESAGFVHNHSYHYRVCD